MLDRMGRIRPGTSIAVPGVNQRTNRSRIVSDIQHLHHVMRNFNADATGHGVVIKDGIPRSALGLEITFKVVAMAQVDAAAVAWNCFQCLRIGERKAIRIANPALLVAYVFGKGVGVGKAFMRGGGGATGQQQDRSRRGEE